MLQKFKNGESFAIRSFSEGWVHVAGCMMRGTTAQRRNGTTVRWYDGSMVSRCPQLSALRLPPCIVHRVSCVVRRVPCDLKKRASLRDSFSKYLHIPSSKRLIPERTLERSIRFITLASTPGRGIVRLALHL